MITEISVPKSGQWWAALCEPVIAMAKAINGLRKLRFVPGAKWDFSWDEGGAAITGPVFGLTLQKIDMCENGVQGYRMMLCSDFVANSSSSGSGS